MLDKAHTKIFSFKCLMHVFKCLPMNLPLGYNKLINYHY